MTEEVEYDSTELERFRLTVLTEVARELVDDFALAAELDLSLHYFWRDTIALRVKQEVYGETLGTLEVKRPATWFQALKEEHAPYWLKQRWPVRYAYQKYDARALYPRLALPDEVHNRTWITRGRCEGYEPERS